MNWYDSTVEKTVMREYKSLKAMQADAEVASSFGWHAGSVTQVPQRSGCMRMIMLGGLGAMIWKPPTRMIVTYRRKD